MLIWGIYRSNKVFLPQDLYDLGDEFCKIGCCLFDSLSGNIFFEYDIGTSYFSTPFTILKVLSFLLFLNILNLTTSPPFELRSQLCLL